MPSRPIREIVNSSALRPATGYAFKRDRRSASRFLCRLPAVLITSQKEFPVECADISSGGLRVTSQRPLRLTVGEQVSVRIRIGPQIFGDAFEVVHVVQSAKAAISIHLRLTADRPAVPAS